jgi:hypothetical protein
LKDDYFLNELLTMSTLPAIHPALVNALVLFAYRLLNNDFIKNNEFCAGDCVRLISDKISNGVPLLQYMGGSFYAPMLKHLDVPVQRVTKNLSQ